MVNLYTKDDNIDLLPSVNTSHASIITEMLNNFLVLYLRVKFQSDC